MIKTPLLHPAAYALLATLWMGVLAASSSAQKSFSGIYPHLAYFNQEGECGTGAVVPWAGSLWVITYAPHQPNGSSDKLHEISPDLELSIYPGSVGGTPANRMIHPESKQLLIGPYLIDHEKQIRVIPPAQMYGRLTGNARHLRDPANKVYYATMEEGLYEVDVNTLAVTCLIRDGNGGAPKEGVVTELPGYHGKGLYSGQGRVVYANNGERGPNVNVDPTTTSGALAQWRGEGDWQLVRRNQFTEVTGPGGIEGNAHPESDPVWSMGWDARSLLLALLEKGAWTFYRLPKSSHSYDGAHGWNTEWPRIRDIGEDDLLATMHGTFWRFPKTFSRKNSAGIAPRSNYLKVVGDFCRWGDRVVLGCDDSAKSEFLNTRRFKAKHAGPMQSNSNLWFIDPAQLDDIGPVIGRGSVWLREDIAAGVPSDPYLFAGYDHRQLFLSHAGATPITVVVEVDRKGTGHWAALTTLELPAGGTLRHTFSSDEQGAWIRLKSQQASRAVTAHFHYRNHDTRTAQNDARFTGLATRDHPAQRMGLMRSLAHDMLGLVAMGADGAVTGYYEVGPDMVLDRVDAPRKRDALIQAVKQPARTFTVDAASVVFEEDGHRYRLPKNDRYLEPVESGAVEKTRAELLRTSLAKDAVVSVSSTHDAYDASHAVDGNTDDASRWISKSTGEKWIALDFGRPKTFASVWIVSGWQDDPQYAIRHFLLQAKVDGEWETLREVKDNHELQVEIHLAAPLSVRELRLVSDDPGYVRVYELAVFDQVTKRPAGHAGNLLQARVCREVATERDLLNVHGTFYELPARNAQGLAKIRPIATHDLVVHDFCSHAGLFLMTGIDGSSKSDHLVRSADGQAAIWAGVIEDLWKLGKPRGVGGPWKNQAVKANEPSDRYLMMGYDRKRVTLESDTATTITLEVDIDGTDLWVPFKDIALDSGERHEVRFPDDFGAYWVRVTSGSDARVSAIFTYE